METSGAKLFHMNITDFKSGKIIYFAEISSQIPTEFNWIEFLDLTVYRLEQIPCIQCVEMLTNSSNQNLVEWKRTVINTLKEACYFAQKCKQNRMHDEKRVTPDVQFFSFFQSDTSLENIHAQCFGYCIIILVVISLWYIQIRSFFLLSNKNTC